MHHNFHQFILLFSLLFGNFLSSETYFVNNKDQYYQATKNLNAGDTVVLENGIWNDFEILFEGQGTENEPIQLKAQTNGQVFITGKSNLKIAGNYLIVSGLIFKDGYTPTNSVIEFRKNKYELANNSRITEIVIDNFNNPDRTQNDNWVTIYGKNNRFDHNHLSGKKNKGVTLVVKLNSVESQNNKHLIDHNYISNRQILGSNGGETLRIGTSHYSLQNSDTSVINNYFDKCDGELEIISNKSGNNKFIGNFFNESRGTLTLRHGNGTLVKDNIFFGNNIDHTGGIRVINKNQTIINNYMEGLKGYRFGGALVVMNGVPNSKINRYHQVENAVISNNSIINSDHIHLAAGSDQERSAVPIESSFNNNLIFHQDNINPIKIFDDVSGISFSNNIISNSDNLEIKNGFNLKNLEVYKDYNNLTYAKGITSIGISKNLTKIAKDKTGVSWYPKDNQTKSFDTGSTIKVEPEDDAIFNAINSALPGDILMLTAGTYRVQRILEINQPITIMSESNDVEIFFERSSLFEIHNKGSLKIKGVKIYGSESPDSSGNSVIRTSKSILDNYKIVVEDSLISKLDVNHSFSFINPSKSSFADLISIKNSTFSDITGSIIIMNKEFEDYGVYNAEYISIEDSRFTNIEGILIDIYRGGTDESTFGPHFIMKGSKLDNIGFGARNKQKAMMRLHGVQVTDINSNELINTQPIKIFHTVGEPITSITSNILDSKNKLQIVELNSAEENTASVKNNKFIN